MANRRITVPPPVLAPPPAVRLSEAPPYEAPPSEAPPYEALSSEAPPYEAPPSEVPPSEVAPPDVPPVAASRPGEAPAAVGDRHETPTNTMPMGTKAQPRCSSIARLQNAPSQRSVSLGRIPTIPQEPKSSDPEGASIDRCVNGLDPHHWSVLDSYVADGNLPARLPPAPLDAKGLRTDLPKNQRPIDSPGPDSAGPDSAGPDSPDPDGSPDIPGWRGNSVPLMPLLPWLTWGRLVAVVGVFVVAAFAFGVTMSSRGGLPSAASPESSEMPAALQPPAPQATARSAPTARPEPSSRAAASDPAERVRPAPSKPTETSRGLGDTRGDTRPTAPPVTKRAPAGGSRPLRSSPSSQPSDSAPAPMGASGRPIELPFETPKELLERSR